MPVEVALVDAIDACIHAARGEVEEAETAYERSLETLRRLNVPRFLSDVLIDYGFYLRERGETSQALPLIVEAVQTSARMQAERLVQRLRTTISDVSVEEWADALLRLQEQQAELARSYAEIRRLEDLRRELTGMIVHDLKNPLTGILTGLQTLRRLGENQAETRRQIVDMAIGSAQSLFNMIQDILDVDRMESGRLELNREETDLGRVVQEAVTPLLPYAQQQQGQLDTSSLADRSLWIDRELIRRVLVNLIGNAIRYATPGPIAISATPVDDGTAVVVSVRDEGPGIPLTDLSRIFDKYARVETEPRARHKQGTGLGLAFCKLAVEAHGGRIWVDSVPGEGSTFSFWLPVEPWEGNVIT
jgi:signal transduction histidine kinase